MWLRRLLLLICAAGLVGAPIARADDVDSSTPADVAAATAVTDPSDTPDDGSADDGSDPDSQDDPADGPVDEGTVDGLDEADAADAATAAAAAVKAPPTVISLDKLLKTGRLDVDPVGVLGAGTVVEKLSLQQGALPKALRGYRAMALAKGNGSADAAAPVTAPLKLTAAGRKALRKVKRGDVRVTVRTDVTLASGAKTSSTRVYVLRRKD